jgi:hypothetical protein
MTKISVSRAVIPLKPKNGLNGAPSGCEGMKKNNLRFSAQPGRAGGSIPKMIGAP